MIIGIQIRSLIADYAVILTIVVFVAVDHYYGLATPKLIVPTVFKVNYFGDKDNQIKIMFSRQDQTSAAG